MLNFVDAVKGDEEVPVEENEEYRVHVIDEDCDETLSFMVPRQLYTPRKEEHLKICTFKKSIDISKDQVIQMLKKGLVRKIISPCVALALW